MERRSTPSKYSHDGNKLVGYAAIWDSPTTIRGEGRKGTFREIIRKGAFTRSLGEAKDVICTFNHDPENFLGRISSGSLKIHTDDTGLRFEVDLPDTTTGRDVKALVARGDLSGASFAFQVKEDKWTDETRELLDLELFELGPVLTPAYGETTLALRSNISFYQRKIKLYQVKF